MSGVMPLGRRSDGNSRRWTCPASCIQGGASGIRGLFNAPFRARSFNPFLGENTPARGRCIPWRQYRRLRPCFQTILPPAFMYRIWLLLSVKVAFFETGSTSLRNSPRTWTLRRSRALHSGRVLRIVAGKSVPRPRATEHPCPTEYFKRGRRCASSPASWSWS